MFNMFNIYSSEFAIMYSSGESHLPNTTSKYRLDYTTIVTKTMIITF